MEITIERGCSILVNIIGVPGYFEQGSVRSEKLMTWTYVSPFYASCFYSQRELLHLMTCPGCVCNWKVWRLRHSHTNSPSFDHHHGYRIRPQPPPRILQSLIRRYSSLRRPSPNRPTHRRVSPYIPHKQNRKHEGLPPQRVVHGESRQGALWAVNAR